MEWDATQLKQLESYVDSSRGVFGGILVPILPYLWSNSVYHILNVLPIKPLVILYLSTTTSRAGGIPTQSRLHSSQVWEESIILPFPFVTLWVVMWFVSISCMVRRRSMVNPSSEFCSAMSYTFYFASFFFLKWHTISTVFSINENGKSFASF
jgi:hypothetical protein